MRGADRAAGAVAAIRGIRNPVLAARAVLDEGRHVLLVGEPAEDFAREAGLETAPEEWFVTERRRLVFERGGTVGAVARDARGGLAAATSTGGTSGKHPGRVGDSPLIGAGTWADDATVAVSCTGDGEAVIRNALAHEVDALMRHAGLPLAQACERAIARIAPHGTGGLIAVGADGVAAPFTTAGDAARLARRRRTDRGGRRWLIPTTTCTGSRSRSSRRRATPPRASSGAPATARPPRAWRSCPSRARRRGRRTRSRASSPS